MKFTLENSFTLALGFLTGCATPTTGIVSGGDGLNTVARQGEGYAATGLAIAILGLYVGQTMIDPVNRPNFFRSRPGELVFGLTGLLLTVYLLFFGFRLFWDNGLWGLLQLFLVVLMTGFLSRLQLLRSGVTPIVMAVLCSLQAYKIW